MEKPFGEHFVSTKYCKREASLMCEAILNPEIKTSPQHGSNWISLFLNKTYLLNCFSSPQIIRKSVLKSVLNLIPTNLLEGSQETNFKAFALFSWVGGCSALLVFYDQDYS